MSFNDFFPYIIPIIAIGLSLASFYYTYHQNKRKIEVNVEVDYTDQYVVKLCAFNSGYRSVAVIKSKFYVNNKILNLKEGDYSDGKNFFWISQTKPIDFPYGLKEGYIICYTFSARQLAICLENKGYSGVVKLSGYFKTAQKIMIQSKNSISFDIEKYKKVKEINNRPQMKIEVTSVRKSLGLD